VPLIAPRVFTMSAKHGSDCTTVILGSGIIGLSTAYYLSESGITDPKSICLVDASPELFRCASGLAGGFLAADCTSRRASADHLTPPSF
jgi:glycine/D-amino acid oxidase-like deaminating enzyme